MKVYSKLVSNSLSIFLIFSSGFGQAVNKNELKRIIIHDFFIQSGFLLKNKPNNEGDLADFRKLVPESNLLKNNMSSFEFNNHSMSSNNFSSIQLGIKFRDQNSENYKLNPLLRLGINYTSGTNLTSSWYRTISHPYDTLTSSQTGAHYYLDSTTTEYYDMTYSSQQLQLATSLIFRTNPLERWSIYSGIGITGGFSIKAITEIYYSLQTSNSDNLLTHSNQNLNHSEIERYRQKTNLCWSTFIPLGIDFRIGNKTTFWKRIHLFCEFKPIISFTSIPELRNITTAGIQQSLGIRINWN